MKIIPVRRKEDGMAVIVVISILSIILIFVAGNLRTLHLLRKEVRFIESQQTNRLAHVGPITNSPSAKGDIHVIGTATTPKAK
jgi:hypothetical protein